MIIFFLTSFPFALFASLPQNGYAEIDMPSYTRAHLLRRPFLQNVDEVGQTPAAVYLVCKDFDNLWV